MPDRSAGRSYNKQRQNLNLLAKLFQRLGELRVKPTDREAHFGARLAIATLDRSVIAISLLGLATKLRDEGG